MYKNIIANTTQILN